MPSVPITFGRVRSQVHMLDLCEKPVVWAEFDFDEKYGLARSPRQRDLGETPARLQPVR